ncbi:MAG: alpha/beta fold hydrolase [Alphaproteobacteria bacterium]
MVKEFLHAHFEDAPSSISNHDKPPIVERPIMLYLHGLLGSGLNWRSVQKQMAALGFRGYALDLRNHGNSFHQSPHNYAAMAQDVIDFMDQKQIDQAIILGHSMGGKVAMQLALTHFKRVAGLIIVDIAPVRYTHGHDDVFDAMRTIDLASNPTRAQVRTMLNDALDNMAISSFLTQNYIEGSAPQATGKWRVNLELLENSQADLVDFDPSLAEPAPYDSPILVIGGLNSRYIQAEYHPHFKKFFPQCQIKMIENAGHWPHIEQAAAFNAHLQLYLNAHASFLN